MCVFPPSPNPTAIYRLLGVPLLLHTRPPMLVRTFRVPAALALLAVFPASGLAQRADTSRAATLAALDSLINATTTLAAGVRGVQATARMTEVALRAQPGNTVGSQSGWGASWGDFFGGVGYQSRARFNAHPDGSASFGFGLGTARHLGGEVSFNSASTLHNLPGTNGSVSVKLHRAVIFRSSVYGVAAGVENFLSWGATDGGSSTYFVVSHSRQMRKDASAFFGSMAWNVGIGNSRFLTEDMLADGNPNRINGFGSIGFRVHSQASFITDWTGQDLALGLSVVPLKRSPVVMSIGLADVTGKAGDGARVVMGMGAGFHIFDPLAKRSKR
jgi:hypothetical protein